MTAEDVRLRASENLIETYMSLGLATPGAEMIQEEGFTGCVGPLQHPMCNFATRLDLNPWSARRLTQIASTREAFNVYCLPTDGPSYVGEVLTRAGFHISYRLVQMVAIPSADEGFETMVEVAPEDRATVARFMADQFFSRQPGSFRQTIASSTAASSQLELYATREKSRIQGAVMFSQTEMMLGCYNLCVAAGSRGRGLGSSIVRFALAEAHRRRVAPTLQCEPRLEGWYSSFGFRSFGTIDVYTLSKQISSDIM